MLSCGDFRLFTAGFDSCLCPVFIKNQSSSPQDVGFVGIWNNRSAAAATWQVFLWRHRMWNIPMRLDLKMALAPPLPK